MPAFTRPSRQFPPLPRGLAVRPVSPPPPLPPLPPDPLLPLEPLLVPLPLLPDELLPPDMLGGGAVEPSDDARVYPPPRTARPGFERTAGSVSPRFTMITGVLPG